MREEEGQGEYRGQLGVDVPCECSGYGCGGRQAGAADFLSA